MANPNPYKDVQVPNWFLSAIEAGDVGKATRYAQFLLHVKRKFEKQASREYYKNRRLREQLEEHGIKPFEI